MTFPWKHLSCFFEIGIACYKKSFWDHSIAGITVIRNPSKKVQFEDMYSHTVYLEGKNFFLIELTVRNRDMLGQEEWFLTI